MKIQNEIEVAAPPGELFDVLADVERVAPLLPGASLEGQEDDDTYKGTVKVKVGPITTSYRGTLRFRELDYDNHRAVMDASGQEIEGQGNTEAMITATVSGSDSKSVLSMETDLEVRGKAAQFGRGAIGNVSQKILDQFARNLESEVLSGGKQEEEQPPEETAPTEEAEAAEQTAPTGDEETGKAPSAKPAAAAPAGEEPLDMLSVFGGTSMLRQAAPAVAGLALGLLIGNFVASRKTLRAYREAMRLMSYGQLYGPPKDK
ncbi:MAG: SRPBCC family protein [Actinomycetota bacterium]|nr:SRPBCC family protein [Actinomycetota bacterium]